MPVALLLQDVVEQRGLAGTQEAGDLRGSGGRAGGSTRTALWLGAGGRGGASALESDLWGTQGVRAGRRGAAASPSQEVRRAVRSWGLTSVTGIFSLSGFGMVAPCSRYRAPFKPQRSPSGLRPAGSAACGRPARCSGPCAAPKTALGRPRALQAARQWVRGSGPAACAANNAAALCCCSRHANLCEGGAPCSLELPQRRTSNAC